MRKDSGVLNNGFYCAVGDDLCTSFLFSVSLGFFVLFSRRKMTFKKKYLSLYSSSSSTESSFFFFFFFFFARSLCGGRGGFSSLARNRRESAQLTVHTLHQPSAK